MKTALTLLNDIQLASPDPRSAALMLLDDIQIASPCPARWEDMVGDNRSRHCRSCERMVYDLSGLTAQEAVALIREKEGGLCLPLFRRADGRTLTADCPEGWKARLEKLRRQGTGVAWLVGVLGCCLFGWLLVFLDQAYPRQTMGTFVFTPQGGIDPVAEELPMPRIDLVAEELAMPRVEK
jgi:hypothetical protein